MSTSSSCFVLLLIFNVFFTHELKISNLERSLSIRQNYLEIKSTFTLKNDNKSPVTFFNFHFDPLMKQNLSYLQAKVSGSNKILKTDRKYQNIVILLDSSLNSGESAKIVTTEIYTHIMTPFPSHGSQFDTQLVVLRFNNYLYSEYAVESQQINLILPRDSAIRSVEGVEPKKQSGSEIIFGPYHSILSFTNSSSKVHFSNHLPFIVIQHHERTIMVSEWGQVRVDEEFHIHHEGTILTGSFDRLQFSMNPTRAAVTSFNMLIPNSASRITYKDDIGNISTSEISYQSKFLKLRLIPRFPIFGGWNGHYTVSYVYPASDSIVYDQKNSRIRVLCVPITGQPMDLFVTDNLKLSIVLPAHARLVGVFIDGKSVRDYEMSKTYSYLDVVGRPTVVMNRKNLVNEHNDMLNIHYEYNSKMLIVKPLYLGTVIFFILFITSLITRLDLSLDKNSVGNTAVFLSHLVGKMKKLESQMQKCLKTLVDDIDAYKKSKDKEKIKSSHNNSKMNYSKIHDQLLKALSEFKSKKTLSADLQKQISSIAEKLSTRLNLSSKQVDLVISAAEETLNREKYTEQNSKIASEIQSISKSIENTLSMI